MTSRRPVDPRGGTERGGPAESDLDGGSTKGPRRPNLIAIGRLILLLAPWALIAYLFRDVDAALSAFEDASVVPMVGGLLLTLVALVGMALLWARLVAHLNRDLAVPSTVHLLRSFARSWLARYLPGKLWAYGARMVHTDASVTPRRIVASSLADELALVVGTAIALGLGLWTWAVAGATAGLPVLLGALAVVIVAVSRLDYVTQLALRLLGRAMPQRWRSAGEELQRAADDPGLGLTASALFTVGYLLTNLLLGVAFVLIVWSVSDIGWGDVTLLIGGYNLAGVVSIIAFFAPAGLGVREGVLAGFLTPVVSAPVAASLAIFMRLLTVLADVTFLALAEGVSLLVRPIQGEASPADGADGGSGVGAPADQGRG
ncbi:MAG: hypothetical protein ACE5KW_05280 [Dehalococcoidia bacterium]